MERPFPAYKGSQPYVFVSYAHDDAAVVYRELTRLRDQGFNIWYDEGISPGSTWRDEVALALTECKLFLFYISPRSIASSNCLQELNFSLSREKKILCVHLEETELTPGIELSLGDKQAIIRSQLAQNAYETKLRDAIHAIIPPPLDAMAAGPITATQPESDDISVAVMPLTNRNLGAEDEYLSDGIAEELISGLSKLDGLRVASQMATFALKNQPLELAELGRRLRVEHVLTGSMQKAGNRIRINVQLNRVSDGTNLWSERYDGSMDDIFELQDDVARKIVSALKVELTGDERSTLIDAGTANVTAYNHFLKGRERFRVHTRSGLFEAAREFQEAIRHDPLFVDAYAAQMACYVDLRLGYGIPTEDAAAQIRPLIAAVRRIRPDQNLYWIERHLESDFQESTRQRENAELGFTMIADPSHPANEGERVAGYWELGRRLTFAGAFHTSLLFLDRYVEDAVAPQPNRCYQAFRVLFAIGEYSQAIERITELVEQDDTLVNPLGERAIIYARTGQYDKAAQDLERLNKAFRISHAHFTYHYWRGDMDLARDMYSDLQSRRHYETSYKAWDAFMMGELDVGVAHLEHAFEQGATTAQSIRVALPMYCPDSIVQQVERHEGYLSFLTRQGIDDAWRDELLQMVRDNASITGIDVHPADLEPDSSG